MSRLKCILLIIDRIKHPKAIQFWDKKLGGASKHICFRPLLHICFSINYFYNFSHKKCKVQDFGCCDCSGANTQGWRSDHSNSQTCSIFSFSHGKGFIFAMLLK